MVRAVRTVSPCQGWPEKTCLRVRGCTYVKGQKRKYCRSRPWAHTKKARRPSTRTRNWRVVVNELRSRRRSSSPGRSSGPKASKTRKRPAVPGRAAASKPRRRLPRGERAQLLRLQGQIAAELKTVVKERAAVEAEGAPRGFVSARESRETPS